MGPGCFAVRDPSDRAIAELCQLLFQEPERFHGFYFHSNHTTSWGYVVHRHEDQLQLDFTRGYRGTVVCGGRSYDVTGAMAFAFYPGTRHSFHYAPVGSRGENYSIHLRLPVTLLAVRRRLFPIARSCVSRDTMLTRALARLYRLSISPRKDASVQIATLTEVLCLWPRSDGKRVVLSLPDWETQADERISRAIWSVEENVTRRSGLDQVARIAGLSRRHFARLFGRAVGTTPHLFVTERLKIRAMEMLGEKRLNVKEIAEALGFSSIYVFSRWFHRVAGVAPTRFMKEAR